MFITKKQGLRFYFLYLYKPFITSFIVIIALRILYNLFFSSFLDNLLFILFINISVFIGIKLNLMRKNKKLDPSYVYIYPNNFFFDKIGFIYKENENFHMNNIQGELSLDDFDKPFTEINKLISKKSINNKAIYIFKLSPK